MKYCIIEILWKIWDIHSISGLLPSGHTLMKYRPFRAPHHNASLNALVGGGVNTICLNAGGYTIAITANGLDICYPNEHYQLMKCIEEKGLMLSEYPPGIRPSKYTFPRRNRLISSWSDKLFVIGAGRGSGALITADYGKNMEEKCIYSIFNEQGRKDMNYYTLDNYVTVDNTNHLQENKIEYLTEKEVRQKRLEAYTEKIQEKVLRQSSEIIRLLVDERYSQNITQQELADITGIRSSNLARFEKGNRIPTLLVLEKYANALGKHIEIKICDL